MTRPADLIIEKPHGYLHVNAGSVAGFAICIHSAAVPNRFQRGNAIFNNFAAGLAIDRHNQTYAA